MRRFAYLKVLVTCFLALSSMKVDLLKAQNLIPDGSFEGIECPGNPINSFSENDQWYTTGADAYLMKVGCPFDPEASRQILALRDIVPYRGVTHISLESILTINNFTVGEGMGIELSQPLKAGRHYYFDMGYMNYESRVRNILAEAACGLPPPRPMYVLFAPEIISITTQSIQQIDGFLITDITTNGRIVLTENAPLAPNFVLNRWQEYWNCFEAVGDERHIAVSGFYGKTEFESDCIDTDQPGFLYSSGHALDELRLFEIPEVIDTSYRICNKEILTIDLKKLAGEPFASKANFTWDDGTSTSERQLSNAGIYNAIMTLPCVEVPISIQVENVNCTANIYVANIFSPNGDRLHDALRPNIFSEVEMTSYSFTIYDRWGNLVFETTDPSMGWSGAHKGVSASRDVYTWKVSYTLENSDEVLHEVGEVMRL